MNEMTRRQLLRHGVGGGVTIGVAKALHNTTVGYGHFGVGENLRTQDLAATARANFRVPRAAEMEVEGYEVALAGESIRYRTDTEEWQDGRHPDAPDRVAKFAADVDDLRAGAFTFAFTGVEEFFSSVPDAAVRAPAVEVLRGSNYARADPAVVAEFVGTSPEDAEGLVRGLVPAFREHGRYDAPRYLAGSIDDNVLPVDADLRSPFRPSVRFDAIAESTAPVGLFCGEFTILANRAIRSVPATSQSPPLYGLIVRDRRHKHVYNGVGSVRRTGDGLELPITFVDYTHTTVYDDFNLTRLLGSGFDAYTTRHRADMIAW